MTFPPGCVVMLIPPEQPRPAGDLAWARTKAVLLTPPAVAADAAIGAVEVAATPPALLLMLFFGSWC